MFYIEINESTDLVSSDNPNISYELVSGGNSPTELLDNAFIVEVLDGVEGKCHNLVDCDERLFRRAAVMIAHAWVNAESVEAA